MKKKLSLAILAILSFAGYSFALDLSGKVVNINTNYGEKNIRITIISSLLPREEFNVTTDSEGSFLISGLKNNTAYMMKAESSKHFLISPTSRKIQTEKNDIKDFDFVYYPIYSVSGTISGKIKPHGLNIMFKSGSPFYNTVLSAVDENGYYKTNGLIYGQEYDAFVSSEFLPFGILGDNSITVSDNNVKNMEIAPVFYGVGAVFDADTKKGMEDITVKAVSSDGLHELSTSTSADGSFILNGLYYGENYIIKINAQSDFEPPLEIKTGIVKSTVTGLNFPLIPNK